MPTCLDKVIRNILHVKSSINSPSHDIQSLNEANSVRPWNNGAPIMFSSIDSSERKNKHEEHVYLVNNCKINT